MKTSPKYAGWFSRQGQDYYKVPILNMSRHNRRPRSGYFGFSSGPSTPQVLNVDDLSIGYFSLDMRDELAGYIFETGDKLAPMTIYRSCNLNHEGTYVRRVF
jgi:hypothetical protein